MSYERHNPYAGTGSCCSNCHRVLLGAWIVCGGPERFCSSQCSAYFYGTEKRATEANRRGDEALLAAPCVFCGYNGPGYWQPITHRPECPWYHLGGGFERSVSLRGVIASRKNASCDLGTNCAICSGAMRERKGGGDG